MLGAKSSNLIAIGSSGVYELEKKKENKTLTDADIHHYDE
jgi:hypothetical protein